MSILSQLLSSKTDTIVEKALDYRSARQKLIAGNIANEDTPFYKARDISFEKALQSEAKKLFSKNEIPKLELAQTNTSHLKGNTQSLSTQVELYYRGSHLQRNDGNTVDLDVETTELTKNTMMFQALISAMKKQGSIYSSVIDASSRTS
ncbi:flagellar basal body rod protein FlgB [Sulfurimonas sp. MAG313]|nr:flagellar basal body rod protein FlgB [Sulfurimonas sp. MAG313]MDF1880193.1 flagellar basal body rod protein FlgB [Sulfurimonas sp. MAG313]